MNRTIAPDVTFEPEFVARLTNLFEELIVFNRTLGLRITEITPTRVAACVEMRPELIGHFTHHRLHGGVISASLDAMGGIAVMAAIGARHMSETIDARMARFGKLGTIDLRVDYLRPGLGPRFSAHAEVMRLGSRVASTRMEFLDAEGRLLSMGSAAYMVS
ncbi:MAG: thioesterase family protein [Burkholderiales bacterium]